MENIQEGLFISLEGGEGSGKTTAASKLAKWYESQGREVLLTREPGGLHVSEQIRSLLFNNEMDTLTEAMLFAASRIELTQKVLLPALKEGKVVICDRFYDTSFVYQGMVKGLGLETVMEINKPILDVLVPDVTLYFDIEPEKGLERIHKNHREENRFDKENLDFHHQVRRGYFILSQLPEFQERFRVINADQTPEKVVKQCITVLEQNKSSFIKVASIQA